MQRGSCEHWPSDRLGPVRNSVPGEAVDCLAEQIRVAAVAGVLLDHVNDRPPEGVLAGTRIPLTAVVEGRRGQIAVGYLDLVPVVRQGTGQSRIWRRIKFFVVVA